MAAIQSLKKQLKGIRSTRKLTKAMKTIATVKFSKLNGMYSAYSEYSRQCLSLFDFYGAEFAEALKVTDENAPIAMVVFSSNKGLCGSFNSELLNFALEKISETDKSLIFACGKKAANFFSTKNIPIEKEYILNDIPSYEESVKIFDDLVEMRKDGKISEIFVIYSEYKNMMTQRPRMIELFGVKESSKSDLMLFAPDRVSVMKSTSVTVYRSVFYRVVLESAIGAQAATLTTMRSAFDTATEYCTLLEGQINRMRQSAVTADVIETSSEHSD